MKANAYGLDADRVVPVLWDAGCRRFFTANLEGALAVRTRLPEAEVHTLNGLMGDPHDYVGNNVVPVLNDLDQVEKWAACAKQLGQRLPAILHTDTGMSRLGLPDDELHALLDRPELIEAIDLLYVMSHLACADEPTHPMNGRQREKFAAILSRFPGVRGSLANSSGIFLGREYHADMIRPGYAVYGGNPTPGRPNPMEPVVRLSAQITQVRNAKPGQTVGYGAHYRIEEPTRIATIPVGYADGYLRALSDRGIASIGGVEVPVVGRVSMDLVTLDIGALPTEKARVGTWVDLIWGREMLDIVAERAGTIGYELLTALGRRYPRSYEPRATS